MRNLRLGKFRNKWSAIWLDTRGQTRRRSLRIDATPSRRHDAERAFERWKRDAFHTGESIADKMEAYMADLDIRAASPERARYAWKALEPFWGHLHPNQIDRDLCRKYTAQRYGDGRQPGTIRKELGVLKAGILWHKQPWGSNFELPSAPPPLTA